MTEVKVVDKRWSANSQRTLFEERAKRLGQVYGADQEYWFRKYYFECFHESILVDAKNAVMTSSEFESLLTYNNSLPSGTYIGKRWKRQCYDPIVQGGSVVGLKATDVWLMGEYCEDDDPRRVKIKWRKILVV